MLKLCSVLAVALVVAMSAFAADNNETGKAVYDQTCKTCHGEGGQGSNVADAFYKIEIPRLASKEVQMRTNPELTKIIKGGTGRMDPVRLGRPLAPHDKTKKLTDQQIADVIAYVRTFWKEGESGK